MVPERVNSRGEFREQRTPQTFPVIVKRDGEGKGSLSGKLGRLALTPLLAVLLGPRASVYLHLEQKEVCVLGSHLLLLQRALVNQAPTEKEEQGFEGYCRPAVQEGKPRQMRRA